MAKYIIPTLFIAVLITGAVYKILIKKDDTPENKEVKETYKENTTRRVINDHMAEIMNIKKKK